MEDLADFVGTIKTQQVNYLRMYRQVEEDLIKVKILLIPAERFV